MSWQEARYAAERWIDQMQLGKIKGRYIDIHLRTDIPGGTDEFKRMILEATRRILTARGAKSVWLPDPPPRKATAE